ncbi:hypothetical protein HPA02_27710 [Bisbaumannia pacifica]|uniref:Peptidase C-terminal archaeal/bacterial domain-containing protein n=1 Tax=Bisbaumannia pacifica TaxID=77098 RepID=A0A510XAN8_9GAMM|nr:hypothetical protein [Halomonas pacifica]GEK48488.1 hypothetical protein HPA02_27710 [Halomonas pacifica]
MANRASSLTLVALGGAALGLLAGCSANTSDDAPVVHAIELGEQFRGEITSSSELNGKDGSRYARHTLSLDADSLVEFELSGALNGSLALYDDETQLLAASIADAYGQPGNALRRRIDETGDYLVVVSGVDASSFGPYDLNSREIELSDSSSELTVSQPLDGWLQDGPSTYPLTIEETGLYRIEMHSDDFDTYLELSGGPNRVRLEDDDGAGNLDSRISGFLEPGDYTVTARSAFGDGSGLYQLSVEPQQLPHDGELRNGGEVTVGETFNGWLSGQRREYSLVVDEAALVTIDMRSQDFDSYLELSGPGVSTSNDDGGSGLDSQIRQRLQPGNYTIVARSFSSSASGLFELSVVSREIGDLPSGGELTLNESLEAWLEPGAQDYYAFEITQAGRYRLDMMSSDLDTYLELEGNGIFESNDDGGNGLDSRIQAYLEPGEYRAIARSYGNTSSGTYTLRLIAE